MQKLTDLTDEWYLEDETREGNEVPKKKATEKEMDFGAIVEK